MTTATLDLRRPIMVVTGLFNPAIFNPQWCARHIFDIPSGETINIAIGDGIGTNGAVAFIRKVGWSVNPMRLEIYVADDDPETATAAESFVQKVFAILPHTPFGALGLNIAISQQEAADNIADLFASNEGIESEYEILSQTVKHSLQVNDDFVLNVERMLDNSGFFVALNYHLEDINTVNVSELTSGAISKYLEHAKTFCGQFYGIDSLLIEKMVLQEM